MIVKNGEIIAIGKVKHDNTLTGTGQPESPLGVDQSKLEHSVYFSANSGTAASSDYFKWSGHTLSASSAVKYFNLSFDYSISPTNDACPDFIYQTQMDVNNTPISDTHYIDGYGSTTNHSVSFNINNGENKTYDFIYSADNKVKLNNLHISCIGFVNSSGDAPVTNIGVLSNEEDRFILFNNNGQNLVLEVD